MMNSADLSGLLGTTYCTVFVDYGPRLGPSDSVHGIRGYSYHVNAEHSRLAAADNLIDSIAKGYPAFMIVTDKFFYGAIDTDFSEH